MGNVIIKQMHVRELGLCYYFDLYAPSRLVLATSQLYTSLDACKRGARNAVRDARVASVDDMTDPTRRTGASPRFELFREGESYRFRLRTQSGDRTLTSQYYSGRELCENAILMVKDIVLEPRFYMLEGYELSELLNVNIDQDEEILDESADSLDMELLTERPLKWDAAAGDETENADEDTDAPVDPFGI